MNLWYQSSRCRVTDQSTLTTSPCDKRSSPLERATIYLTMRLSSFANDHRTWKTGLPVRSAVLKPCAGRLVVGWVTTSESLLLFVLHFLWCCGGNRGAV